MVRAIIAVFGLICLLNLSISDALAFQDPDPPPNDTTEPPTTSTLDPNYDFAAEAEIITAYMEDLLASGELPYEEFIASFYVDPLTGDTIADIDPNFNESIDSILNNLLDDLFTDVITDPDLTYEEFYNMIWYDPDPVVTEPEPDYWQAWYNLWDYFF